MNEGKIFEADFKKSCPESIYILRIKDPPVGNDIKASKNPFDFLMFKDGYLFMVELKSTKGTSFSFNEKIIKSYQIKELNNASTFDKVIPGFIFNFRKYNKTYFVPIKEFIKFQEESGKESINKKDCEEIGIEISQRLKRVFYEYEIEEFVCYAIMIENLQ